MDKLRLGCDVKELKIGGSFKNTRNNNNSTRPSSTGHNQEHFHALKCDFKPASVDPTKMGTLALGSNNQVTVTVPHLDGSGIPQTVFKGSQRQYTKECVLIIDRITGEMTLEKLYSNIQVKKTRQEPPQKPTPAAPSAGTHRPHTPVDLLPNNCTQRSSSWTRVTSGGKKKVNPVINPPKTSPPRYKSSPPQAAPWSASAGQSTLASLPMIGLDDGMSSQPNTQPPPLQQPQPMVNGHKTLPPQPTHTMPDDSVGVLSSSSGSSSSDSESDNSDSGVSDSDVDNKPLPPASVNISVNAPARTTPMKNGSSSASGDASMPVHLLNDDLCLSESGSDSD